MSNIMAAGTGGKRDLPTITAEIRMIDQQAKQYVVQAVVEIGRRLEEAKSMLEHGQWGAWVKEELGYSQSTAQNYMKIYKEFGADQLTLDGAVANSQALGNLSYTKALKLLALPAEEREEFVEAHDVEGMSTRELERVIKERDAAQTSAELAQKRAEDLQGKLEEISRTHEEALREESRRTCEAVELANGEAAKRKVMEAQLAELTKEAQKAEEDAEQARAQLAELKKNPEIPAEKLLELTEAAKEEVRKEAQEQVQKELAKRKEEADRLEKAIREAKEAQAKAEAEAMEIRKKLAVSDPGVVEFKYHFEQLQKDWASARSCYEKVAAKDAEAAKKLQAAMRKLLENWTQGMEG